MAKTPNREINPVSNNEDKRKTYQMSENGYLCALNKTFENIDIAYFLDLLARIEEWKKYRNEVIHSLMNKNIVSIC